jgi:hypothetical protein
VVVPGEELAQLTVDEGAGLAEELIALSEQLRSELLWRNAEFDVGIGGIGCVGGHELAVHAAPSLIGDHVNAGLEEHWHGQPNPMRRWKDSRMLAT